LLPMELPSMSSVGGSRARTFHSLASVLASKVRDLVCGRSTGGLLASYDPASSSWRTSQACLVSGWEPFSETFPRSGMMLSGTVYQLVPSAPLTDGIGYGLWPTPDASVAQYGEGTETWLERRERVKLTAKNGNGMGMPLTIAVQLWPTPVASNNRKSAKALASSENNGRRTGGGNSSPPGLEQAVELAEGIFPEEMIGLTLPPATEQMIQHFWPTPNAGDYKAGMSNAPGRQQHSLPRTVGIVEGVSSGKRGGLNPTWVEWLMGFPLKWTALEPSATPSSRKSRKSSDKRSFKQREPAE